MMEIGVIKDSIRVDIRVCVNCYYQKINLKEFLFYFCLLFCKIVMKKSKNFVNMTQRQITLNVFKFMWNDNCMVSGIKVSNI